MQDPGKMLYEFSRGSEAPLVTGDNNPTFWEAAHLSLSLSLFYIYLCEFVNGRCGNSWMLIYIIVSRFPK